MIRLSAPKHPDEIRDARIALLRAKSTLTSAENNEIIKLLLADMDKTNSDDAEKELKSLPK